MHYLSKLIIISILLELPCLANNTVLIKKYRQSGSTILDKKIRYLDMGRKPLARDFSSFNLNQLAAPAVNQTKSSEPLSKTVSKVKRLAKKDFKVSSIKSTKKTGITSTGDYNDDDWGEYLEYQDIEFDESLNVNAKIIN